MPRSRSRERRRSREKKSRSRDRRSRSRDKRSRSRDVKRRDRSHSRDKQPKRDRHEASRYSKRDRSSERHRSSRYRDRSSDRRRRDHSSDRRRDRSSSRSRKSSREKVVIIQPSLSSYRKRTKIDSNSMPNEESTSSNEPTEDPRKAFEIANEFSREGFEQFTRDHGIDFTKIETEEDRVAVHDKMEELLKEHFAAQGKVYPPPKVEKPLINAATGFVNDGSFMEQFKKMQEEYKMQLEADKKRRAAEERLKSLPIRRRGGGKILKTGVVAKTKLNEDGSEAPNDAWSIYLKEVQKYKSSSCDTDSSTRPLVK